MGIKKGKTVYNKILARMGCGDYKKWNIDLFETLYLIFDYPYKYYTFKHFEV